MNTQTRIFDRNSYSQKTISIYQIVGAYLVDVYYNHLYVEAVKLKNQNKVPSITEGYKHATYAFISALDNKSKSTYKVEHYTKLLTGINNYFVLWTSYNSLTLSDCIDKIVKEFIPNDFHQNLDKDQKRNILRTILINSIKEFTKIIITEFLSAIIDNHEDAANTDLLKERIIDIFISERENMYHKFLLPKSPNDELVDKKFAEKMRAEITKLHEERLKMIKIIKEYEKEVEVRKDQLSKVLLKYRSIEGNSKSNNDENRILKDKNTELERRLSDLRYKVEQLEMQLRQEKATRAQQSSQPAQQSSQPAQQSSQPAQQSSNTIQLSRTHTQQQQQQQQQIQQQPKQQPKQTDTIKTDTIKTINNSRLNNSAFIQKMKEIENYNSDSESDAKSDISGKSTKSDKSDKFEVEQQNQQPNQNNQKKKRQQENKTRDDNIETKNDLDDMDNDRDNDSDDFNIKFTLGNSSNINDAY